MNRGGSSGVRFAVLWFSGVTLWFVYSCLALVSGAAPVPSSPAAPLATAPANTYRGYDDNEAFAHLLLQAVTWISEIYVRPVSRVDLLHTALTALYETARRPVPRDLRQRIERAEKLAAAQAAEAANTPPPLVPALAQPRPPLGDDTPIIQLIRTVRADLGRVENLGGTDPLHVGCQAILRSLDPYSCVITSKEDRRAIGAGSERDGFGLEVPEDDNQRVCIRDVLPGSPAQEAGLRIGDEIIRLHDSDGRERSVKESLNVLNGRAPLLKPQLGPLALPEPITITYRRPPHPQPLSTAGRGEKENCQPLSPGGGGEKELLPSPRWGEGLRVRGKIHRVTLEWRHFRAESVFGVTRRNDNSWNYWLDAERKIAHLRLGNLAKGTPDELSDILAALRRDGLRGLILDLRWCPGGDLVGAVRTAELFLGEGTIATVRYRKQPEQVFRSTNEDKHNDFPMVVLISGDSTGGAEMIAAALQDHHRAVLVGQRTHGKGNMQNLTSIGSLGIKVTSGTLVRPSGKPLHRFPDSKPDDPWGVQPNRGHEFRVSAEVTRTLRTWWEEQTMRRGSSTQRLPLDDPLADPQRNAALEAIEALANRQR
jgi:carboxyl-terminal processing protease